MIINLPGVGLRAVSINIIYDAINKYSQKQSTPFCQYQYIKSSSLWLSFSHIVVEELCLTIYTCLGHWGLWESNTTTVFNSGWGLDSDWVTATIWFFSFFSSHSGESLNCCCVCDHSPVPWPSLSRALSVTQVPSHLILKYFAVSDSTMNSSVY